MSDQRPAPLLNFGKYSAQVGIICLAYFAAGRLGLSVRFTSGNVSPVWPASGIALAGVLLCGYRVWPGIFVGAFLVNFLSPIPHATALGLAIGNTLAAVTGARLLRRIPHFDSSLSRLRDVLGLVILGAAGSTMVAASIGVAVLFATKVRPWSDVGSAWLVYWLGDAMGILIVAPVILSSSALLRRRESFRVAELLLTIALVTATSVAVFDDRLMFAVKQDVLAFVVFPFVIWAAIRFGIGGASLVTLLVAIIAVLETAYKSGPFTATDSPLLNVVLLQVFLSVISVSALVLAAVISERAQLISEKAAREALRERDERARELADIVDSSDDAIISKDMQGIIRSWNKGAEQLYGYSAKEVIGKPASILMPSDQVDDFPQIMRKLKQGERIYHYETVRQRKDGTRLDVALTVSPVRNSAGDIVRASAIARNITERKQAEEALRKSEKLAASGRLAATIAHEINNPLESLTNLFYLLAKHPSLDDTARRYARAAEQELKRTTHITKQMLAFHRESSRPVAVKVSELLESVLELFNSQIHHKGIQLIKRYTDSTHIDAFPAELRQVFANLIGNAIDAVGKEGKIVLHVREWNGTARRGVRISIADAGSGISSANLQRLFEPFFTTKGNLGTGLGLWVSNGIVQKHDGSIRVRSTTRQGRSGTVFSIFLPIISAGVGGGERANALARAH